MTTALEQIREKIAMAPEGDKCVSEHEGKCPHYRLEIDWCTVLSYKVNGQKHCRPNREVQSV